MGSGPDVMVQCLPSVISMGSSVPFKRRLSIPVNRMPWSPETSWTEDLPFDYVDIKPHREDAVPRAHAVDTVLFGGLTAGLLDALDAIVINGPGGVHATQVFQSVASGLLGPRALLSLASGNGGMPTLVMRVNELLIHAFGFGLPISLFASRSVHRALK